MNTKVILMDYIMHESVRGRLKEIGENDDLLSSGILDSLGILKLVTFIEERFGFRMPDEDVVYENFHTVEALTSYLGRHKL
jgi:acyl carrier protein